jgi:hypothetical protein
MAHQTRIDGAVVQAKKRCIFYRLFEFIFPTRGRWTEPEEQKDILKAFLRSHDLPTRSQKYNGKTVDGGNHSVESLWEAIRTGIQQNGRTPAICKSPVLSFFKYGHEAVTSNYYHKVVTTFSEWYPNEQVHNRWQGLPCTKSTTRNEQEFHDASAEKSLLSCPIETSAALSGQIDPHIGPLASERKRGQDSLTKEVAQLLST